MLQLAWEQDSPEYEIEAYGNLAIDYYYMGSLAQSLYYENRSSGGMIEEKSSLLK